MVDDFEPKVAVGVDNLVWAKKHKVNWKNDPWRFRVMVDERSRIVAKIIRGARARSGPKPAKRQVTKRTSRVVSKTRAELKQGFFSWVKFKRKRLSPGNYQIIAKITAVDNSDRVTTLKSKKFTVKPKKTRPKRA